MSWQDYVDKQLLASRCVTKAAIAGHDGNLWAKSEGFEVSNRIIRAQLTLRRFIIAITVIITIIVVVLVVVAVIVIVVVVAVVLVSRVRSRTRPAKRKAVEAECAYTGKPKTHRSFQVPRLLSAFFLYCPPWSGGQTVVNISLRAVYIVHTCARIRISCA